MEAEKMKDQGSKYRPMMVDFLLPESDKDQGENPIGDDLIYIWDLKSTSHTEETKRDKIIEKEVTVLSNLKWSDTDNFYMNLGSHKVRRRLDTVPSDVKTT